MGLTPMPHGGDIPGIDADAERFGAFLLIAGVVLFVISAFYSATEFRYAAFGKTATANVQNVRRITEPGRGRARVYQRVDVQFQDGGVQRDDRLRAPLDVAVPIGGAIEVDYLPNVTGRVRLHGQREILWMAVFLGSVAWVGWSLARLIREARQIERRATRRRRRESRP